MTREIQSGETYSVTTWAQPDGGPVHERLWDVYGRLVLDRWSRYEMEDGVNDMGKPTEAADARSKDVYGAVGRVIDVPIEDMGFVDKQRLLDATNLLSGYLGVRFIARL